MSKRKKRALVIDANVARAAGRGTAATHPTSKTCRDFLLEMLRICYRVTMSHELHDEWKAHASTFARQWQVGMVSRKKWTLSRGTLDASVREAILETVGTEKSRAAVEKDLHLVGAALAEGKAIVSLDETARNHFAKASASVPILRALDWVNPASANDRAEDWLRDGAPLGSHGLRTRQERE